MTFLNGAENVRVEDGHILRARLQRGDGEWNDAEIDLNNHLGNNNGNFAWDGQGFQGSADNIRFSLEQDGAIAVLRAILTDGEGNGQDRDINLNERIFNNDGNFQYN